MTKDQSQSLLNALISTIERWNDGYQLHVHYAYDGDGHFDFMGLTINPPGREELEALLKEHLK